MLSQSDLTAPAPDSPLQARFRRGSRVAGYLLVVLGLCVLADWAFDIRLLQRVAPSFISMKVHSALLFVIYGAALAMRGPAPHRRDVILGGAVVIIAGISLYRDLFGAALGIDPLLFQDSAPAAASDPAPLAAATCFLLLGLALPLSDTRWSSLSLLALLAVANVALFAILGHLYNVDALFHIAAFNSVAPHAGVGLVVAAVAATLSRPTTRLVALLSTETIAGSIARRGLPLFLGVPLVVGWVAMRTLEERWFEPPVIAALGVLGSMLAFGGLGAMGLLSLERSERVRVAAETETGRQREKLSITLKSIGDAVITTDAAGRVSSMNPAAERLTGWSEADADGRELVEVFNIVSEADRSRPVSPVERVLREGCVVGLANHTLLIARDGTERPIGDSAAPIRDGGELLGVVLVFRDMTEEVRAGTLLRRAAERARLLAGLTLEFATAADSVPGLLELIATRASAVLTDLAVVLITDASTGALSAADFGVDSSDPTLAAEFRGLLAMGGLKLGEGISGEVAATGTARLVVESRPGEIAASVAPKLRDLAVRLAPTSVLSVPLRSRGRCLGVITLSRFAHDRSYTEDDLALAAEIADRAAIMLDNAFLLRDVADRAADLACEEARFRGVVETMPDALLVVDGEGLIQVANAQAEAQFGYDPGQLVGQVIEVLVPVAARGQHPAHRAARERSGDERAMMTLSAVPALRRDGSEFPAEITLGPVRTPTGRWTVAVVRDITARLELEATSRRAFEYQEISRAANEANRLKSEFLTNISHELRTPLSSILGFTRLVAGGKAGPVTAKQVEYLYDVEEAGCHLLQLINDLLDLSKIEAGHMDLHIAVVNLGQIAQAAVATCEGYAVGRTVTLRCTVEPALPERQSDPLRLTQVLYNLLSNAIKFTPERGTVELHAGMDAVGNWTLSVIDQGIGISAANLGRLFTPFQQLDAGLARHFHGTGLGLALTRRLVHALGGTIGVTSEVGRGSTFTVTLPLLGGAHE